MKVVVFVGALHHLRYIEYICNYYKLKKEDIYLYLFLNGHQGNFNNSDIGEFKKVGFYYESSLFSFKSIQVLKKKFFQLFSNDLSISDNVNLFTCISYDYAMVFKSKYTNTNVLLLDDGFGVFSNINYFTNQKYYIRLRYFILSVLTFSRISSPFDFKYFTEYGIEGIKTDKVIRYNRKKIKLEDEQIDNGLIIILGTTEVELGIINLDYYLSLLLSGLNKYRGYKFYYYPHRKESEFKLKEVEKLGIYIQIAETPFENYILNAAQKPKYIIGFTSSNAIYEFLSKFDSKINVILIDNLNESHNMPLSIKKYILSTYNKFNCIKHNF